MHLGILSASFIDLSSLISASTKDSVESPFRPMKVAISPYLTAASGFFELYLITLGRYIAFAQPWTICPPEYAAPVLCAIEWTIPSNALEKAIPARHCALCILSLASISPLYDLIKSLWIILIAWSASGSV